MKEEIKRLQYKTKANDVDDEKGIVTVAVNGIGVKDSQDDISMPGSFNKTLKENIGRMRWFSMPPWNMRSLPNRSFRTAVSMPGQACWMGLRISMPHSTSRGMRGSTAPSVWYSTFFP